MHPILGRTFAGFIFTFTVVIGLSILIGFALTHRLNRHKIPDWADTAVFVMLFAWMGGRAGFIWVNWDFYQEEPSQIYKLWQGGQSYHGAMIAGLLALTLWSVLRKRPFAQYAALFIPALVLIHAGGWLACYYEGCAFGTEAFIGPFTANLPDTFGVFAVRYKTQLAGFILTLLLFGLILWLRNQVNEWQLSGIALIGLSLIHLLIGNYRGDIVFANLTNGIDLGFILLGIGFLGYGRWPKRKA